ncbi:hypothetical protein [Nocardia brasiliensis]|uniref:hypothetical protein n=1 Tax=Nocardia brasiliensis TaxID=37326 RepID=UPI002456911B|nr:hypothetical protein [Nocardia brasiliensis]
MSKGPIDGARDAAAHLTKGVSDAITRWSGIRSTEARGASGKVREMAQSATDVDSVSGDRIFREGALSATSDTTGSESIPVSEMFPRRIRALEYVDPDSELLVRKFEPVLAQRLVDLQDAGWRIDFGDDWGVSWADKENLALVVDPNGLIDKAAMMRNLARVANRAHPNGYDPWPMLDGHMPDEWVRAGAGELRGKELWVSRGAFEHLMVDADAHIEARDSRNRIIERKGPDIGLDIDTPDTEFFYDEYYRGAVSREFARKMIGSHWTSMGHSIVEHGTPQTHLGNEIVEAYYRHYTGAYGKLWDDFYGM